MRKYEKYKGLAYLTLLLLVIPYLVWSMAISETVAMWRFVHKTATQIALLEADTVTSAAAMVESANGKALFEGRLIEAINPLIEKYQIKVVKFTPYISEKSDGAVLHTAVLILEGGYTGLVRTIEHIENNVGQSRLVSVAFKSMQRDRSRPPELTTTLILQQIITEK